ncbi:glycosyltransferase [Desulfovibrio subterraneus]|uniref:glycosyltransferase n=1 Tax=Desulfovibrio subterraneus TaxID=2718620 RepID=UPI0022B8FE31|nr:glycosyltransferase [Desulfovibrio subterraneus]WBF68142.1 glycosyltransferase [Desulfovibrio subterraneus]
MGGLDMGCHGADGSEADAHHAADDISRSPCAADTRKGVLHGALLGVHMHTVLAWRGGAARVASMLRYGLEACDVRCSASCEVNDAGTAQDNTMPHTPVAGASIAGPITGPITGSNVGSVGAGRLLHVHGSLDWVACLESIAKAARPAVITLHDCSLLTGGCPYPLDCPGIFEGCLTPCPRGYANAATEQRRRHKALAEAHRLAGVQLVSPSGWLKGLVRSVLPQMPCSVIPNGVEPPMQGVTRSAARKKFGIDPDAKLVLFMAHGGEQAAYKSGDRWQEVWQSIRQRADGVLGFMVGGEVHDRGGDCIRWPYLDREHAQLCMAAADCFAYPTIADNHPLVVLEAMSLGCPVVAFDVGGLREQVQHGETGLLVPAGDWPGFVNACVSVLSSAGTRRALAAAGIEAYARKFTQDRMVRGYLALYARVLQA